MWFHVVSSVSTLTGWNSLQVGFTKKCHWRGPGASRHKYSRQRTPFPMQFWGYVIKSEIVMWTLSILYTRSIPYFISCFLVKLIDTFVVWSKFSLLSINVAKPIEKNIVSISQPWWWQTKFQKKKQKGTLSKQKKFISARDLKASAF